MIADDADPAFFKSRPIPTDPARYPYNHAASIVQAPNGDLLVAWGAGSRELGSDTLILLSRRASDGEWTDPLIVADKPDFADANPVLFVDDAAVIRLMYVEMFGDSFCLGKTQSKTSVDNGLTWSDAAPLLDAFCTMLRGRPIITADGLWLLPAYDQALYQSQFWTSQDRGATWHPGPKLFTIPANLQPAVVQLADASLFALMRNGSNSGQMLDARADACANNWTVQTRQDLPNPNSGIELIRLDNGDLVAIYNDSRTDRTPLVAALSSDGGHTWTRPRPIAEGLPQVSYPSAIQDSSGTIHVVFSYHLERIEHAAFNRAWLAGP